jgi:hypothetical protein
MSDTSTINYTDILFGKECNIPSLPPHYLISVISMIIRDPANDNIKVIIQKDPLLREVLFIDQEYNKKLILVLVKMIQQSYGIDFQGLGHFSKDNFFTKEEYQKSLFYQSISLLWNYSPVVSSRGTLDVLNL